MAFSSSRIWSASAKSFAFLAARRASIFAVTAASNSDYVFIVTPADRIMTEIDHYLDAHADEECFVTLIAKIPADHIYLRHRFEYIDPERRYGMIRHQDDRPAKKYSPI